MSRVLTAVRRSTLRIALACALMGMMVAPAKAQSGIRIHMHGQDGYAADGLLYVPTGQGPFPAIMLIPDERGLTQRIGNAGENFAKAGYLVVAVDLNRGLSEGAAKRSEEQVRLDLDAALTFLGAQSNVQPGSIGAMGWGSGGISALRLAADAKLTAVVIESVPLAGDLQHLTAMNTPVLGIFTARDRDTDAQSIAAFERRLRALDKSVTIKLYADVDSGFDDPEDTGHFRSGESADAGRISIEFFTTQCQAQPAAHRSTARDVRRDPR